MGFWWWCILVCGCNSGTCYCNTGTHTRPLFILKIRPGHLPGKCAGAWDLAGVIHSVFNDHSSSNSSSSAECICSWLKHVFFSAYLIQIKVKTNYFLITEGANLFLPTSHLKSFRFFAIIYVQTKRRQKISDRKKFFGKNKGDWKHNSIVRKSLSVCFPEHLKTLTFKWPCYYIWNTLGRLFFR